MFPHIIWLHIYNSDGKSLHPRDRTYLTKASDNPHDEMYVRVNDMPVKFIDGKAYRLLALSPADIPDDRQGE